MVLGDESSRVELYTEGIMELTLIQQQNSAWIEGVPGEAWMATLGDLDRLIEACFSNGVQAALLYAANLTPAFFDLSSGEAGAIMQKLRIYRLRLAVVYNPDEVQFSRRFGELLTDERGAADFGLFTSWQAAQAWLCRSS